MFNIPQKFDGVSVLPAAEFNSLVDELKNIITSSGQALTGADVTQIAKGIANYVMNGHFFTDSGVANAYLLTVVGAKLAPTSYTNGFTVLFKVGNTNTGASSVNVAGLGVKSIKKNNGADDLNAGDLQAGGIVELVYDSSGDYFELTRTEFIAGDFLRRDQTANLTVGYTTTAFALGNSGTGTVTPLIANGHIQTLTINGNFTLAAPTDTESGIIEIQATNAAPGGFSINTAAYTIIQNEYDNSNGKINIIRILKVGATSYISIRPVPIVATAGSNIGLENVIINPEMIITQRGTSFAIPAAPAVANVYTLDRWQMRKSNDAAVTIAQSSIVPTVAQAGYLFQNSLSVTTNTADGSLVNQGHAICQLIEGYNWANLAQRTFSIGFWVRSSITGTYCIGFINSGVDRSYVAEYTINNANTWEYKTITVSASPAAGTWNYTNGIGIYVFFTLSANGVVTTSPNSWQTGNFYGTVNQVNHAGTNGATFFLTGVTMVAGSSVPAYQPRQFGDEILLCKRYYEKSYNLNVNPGTAVATPVNAVANNGEIFCSTAVTTIWVSAYQTYIYRVIKRSAPTIAYYNPNTGATGQLRNISTNVSPINISAVANTTSMTFAVGSALTVGNGYSYHFVAEAEL